MCVCVRVSLRACVRPKISVSLSLCVCLCVCVCVCERERESLRACMRASVSSRIRLLQAKPRASAIASAMGARADWGVVPHMLHDLFTAIERELADGR